MKRRQSLFLWTAALGLTSLVAFSAPAMAATVFEQCNNNPDSVVCQSRNDNAASMMQVIINTLLYVIGIAAVIMIVVGGIRYSLSSGNPSQIKEAKDTIIYAVIGLVVAILSYAIVNFVVRWF